MNWLFAQFFENKLCCWRNIAIVAVRLQTQMTHKMVWIEPRNNSDVFSLWMNKTAPKIKQKLKTCNHISSILVFSYTNGSKYKLPICCLKPGHETPQDSELHAEKAAFIVRILKKRKWGIDGSLGRLCGVLLSAISRNRFTHISTSIMHFYTDPERTPDVLVPSGWDT